MKQLQLLILTIGIAANFANGQNVQRWEWWQNNLVISDGNARAQPTERNWGLHLWQDAGFGMELHNREGLYGTAIFTRGSHEKIWLGNYNSSTSQQQQFTPWMTLVHARVGIGTSPDTKLDMVTSAPLDGFRITHSTNQGFVNFQSASLGQSAYNDVTQNQDAGIIFGSRNGIGQGTFGFVIAPHMTGASGIRIDNQGNVGIATSNTLGYRLAVNGNVICEKVVVKLKANWPDYVFHASYRLRPLSEVEQYIKLYHHLPEVPSADEIEKDGLDVGGNQAVLLKKIEELTLYVIEQSKKLEDQQKLIKDQQEQLNAVKQQLNTLRK